jgi:YD repeat-containing protein
MCGLYSTTYDAVSRPYDETVKYLPGGDRILQHRYDRFGNRNQLTLQDGAAITNTYTYNKLDQPAIANLAGAAMTLGYFANDDRQSVILPNGVTESFAYRPNGPVENMTFAGPSAQIAQFAYTYDDVLNVDTQTDQYGLHDFNYDGLNRLTQTLRPAASALPNESYAYDRVANREDPGNSALYEYDANNRITASPGLTYTFDADGSLATRSDAATFTHDAQNRLTQYVKGSTTTAYLYDAFGRRIRKAIIWDKYMVPVGRNPAAGRIRCNRYSDAALWIS